MRLRKLYPNFFRIAPIKSIRHRPHHPFLNFSLGYSLKLSQKNKKPVIPPALTQEGKRSEGSASSFVRARLEAVPKSQPGRRGFKP
jgi:hypothetical protein